MGASSSTPTISSTPYGHGTDIQVGEHTYRIFDRITEDQIIDIQVRKEYVACVNWCTYFDWTNYPRKDLSNLIAAHREPTDWRTLVLYARKYHCQSEPEQSSHFGIKIVIEISYRSNDRTIQNTYVYHSPSLQHLLFYPINHTGYNRIMVTPLGRMYFNSDNYTAAIKFDSPEEMDQLPRYKIDNHYFGWVYFYSMMEPIQNPILHSTGRSYMFMKKYMPITLDNYESCMDAIQLYAHRNKMEVSTAYNRLLRNPIYMDVIHRLLAYYWSTDPMDFTRMLFHGFNSGYTSIVHPLWQYLPAIQTAKWKTLNRRDRLIHVPFIPFACKFWIQQQNIAALKAGLEHNLFDRPFLQKLCPLIIRCESHSIVKWAVEVGAIHQSNIQQMIDYARGLDKPAIAKMLRSYPKV